MAGALPFGQLAAFLISGDKVLSRTLLWEFPESRGICHWNRPNFADRIVCDLQRWNPFSGALRLPVVVLCWSASCLRTTHPPKRNGLGQKKTLALHGIIFNYYWEGPYLRVLFSWLFRIQKIDPSEWQAEVKVVQTTISWTPKLAQVHVTGPASPLPRNKDQSADAAKNHHVKFLMQWGVQGKPKFEKLAYKVPV